MVATATATSGAIDRIVADSTLMVVFAVWAYGMTTGRVQRLHAPA
jgi:hypothetical protein